MIGLFLLAFSSVQISATEDAIDKAIAFMKSAEKKVAGQKGKCAVNVQTKAARMQLELSREMKDNDGARSMAGGLRELAQEANAQCSKAVGTEIEKAALSLEGQKVEPTEEDADMTPEQPAEEPKVEPAKPNAKKPVFNPPPAQKPFISSPTTLTADPDTQIGELAKQITPTFRAVGMYLKGLGKRTDWTQQLEAGKCYAFFGVGQGDVRKIALYLFDPQNRRKAESVSMDTRVVMYHCPATSGAYHLQAKVKKEANYAVGVYAR